MVSIWSVIFICLGVFFFATSLAGYAFAPEKFPINWWELGGWILYILMIISWEIARK